MKTRTIVSAVIVCAATATALGVDEPAPPAGCSPADLAEPYGIMTVDDIWLFVNALAIGDPEADLVPPYGVIDILDIEAFIASFLDDCRAD